MHTSLLQHKGTLIAKDPRFVLEMSWLEQAPAQLDTVSVGKISAILPTTTGGKSMESVATELRGLERMPFMNAASATTRGQCKHLAGVVDNMVLGISPKPSDRHSFVLYTSSLAQRTFFFEYEDSTGITLRGVPGLTAFIEKSEKEFEADTKVLKKDLSQ